MTTTTHRGSRPRRALRALALLAGLPLLAARPAAAGPIEGTPPYRQSAHIAQVAFDWRTYKRLAPGSDNWPLTWSADGHQYTSFGDGGGFGGTNSLGRVSLGFARVEGTAASHLGRNVWGGADATASAKFTGKSYGVLAVGRTLYAWRCGAGSNATAYDFQQLHRSTDDARTWQPASWQFAEGLLFYCPTFVQFGQGYAGARDGYVYMHAAQRDDGTWGVHKPGEIVLLRAPQARLMERAAYQFFAGTDAAGRPRWSAAAADREPVFRDPRGARLASVAYNPGLRRYLLATEHDAKGRGNVGVFDAPEPWGPWTTVLYETGWGAPHVEASTFFVNFAPKWWTDGGRGFTLVFTGSGSLDAWNSVRGSFTTP